MFATVKRKATKVGSTTKVVTVRNSDDRIPYLLFGMFACTFFPTTFLEIAVCRTDELDVVNK